MQVSGRFQLHDRVGVTNADLDYCFVAHLLKIDRPSLERNVIRLTGTNEEIAVKILAEAGFTAMTDMDEAVKRAVALAKGEAQ